MANKNLFTTVKMDNPQSNVFDLSHDLKLSFKIGSLVPTAAIECLPGDSFTIGFENLVRFAALLSPVMHRVKISTHYFFVPNRIIWDNWDEWITGNYDAIPPFFTTTSRNSSSEELVLKGSIADYMGIPPLNVGGLDRQYVPEINALPFAAYAKIYHEFYMDQNNTPEAVRTMFEDLATLTDGDNSARKVLDGVTWNGVLIDDLYFSDFFNQLPPLKRAFQHDYFTSALPWAQKGDQVFMPIADFNDVLVKFDQSLQAPVSNTGGAVRNIDGTPYNPGAATNMQTAPSSKWVTAAGVAKYYDPNDSLVAQTSELAAGTASINNLRRAFRLQEWLEKNARGGTRYAESLMVHFGVRPQDSRLQRPEYLGGAVQNMVISEVLSTAQTLDGENIANPVGQMAGHAVSVGGSRVLKYYCQEHGFIIGLISIMPDTAYSQGLHRKFSRQDRLDYAWPTFANIGEQEILSQEIFLDPSENEAANKATFGYVPRYSEYKYECSRVAGDFRDTLDFWHMARQFAERPVLNEEFIYPQDNIFDRIFAVDASLADPIYAHILNKVRVKRKLPYYGTPSL